MKKIFFDIKTYIVFIIALICTNTLATTVIKFHSLNVDDGLSEASVRAITQDKLGYIWFGTEQGLSRFDGINLKNYQANSENALSGNYFTAFAIDSKGELWAATAENGLNQYLPATDSFRSFKTTNSALSSNDINALLADSNQILWIGSVKGLDRYDIVNKSVVTFGYDPVNVNSLPDPEVHTLLRAHNGDLWIGTDKGIALLKKNEQRVLRIPLPENSQLKVKAFDEDKEGNIWIGTSKGVYLYRYKTKDIIKPYEILNEQYILSLLISESGDLWVGTRKDGVYHIDNKDHYSHFVNDKGDDKSLGDKTVLSLFQDFSGTIWIGTYNAGIHWFDPTVLSMGAHDGTLSSIPCLPSNQIFSALPIDDGKFIFATSLGLSFVDLLLNECTNYTHSETDQNTLSNDSISSIFLDQSNILWVGTLNGFDRLDINRNTVTRFGKQLANKSVVSIKQNINGQLILGTNSGLYLSNSEKSQFQLISSNEYLRTAIIYETVWDKSGNLWVGSDKGLLFVSNLFDKIELIYADPETNFVTHVRSIIPINEDSILLSIDGRGLFMFSTKTHTLDSVAKKYDINVQHAFSGFVEDSDGYIWLMTTNNGLYRFHPDKQGSTHYSYDDGLISNYVMPRSAKMLADGSLFFGSRNGFSLFNPKEIQRNLKPAGVAITNLFLNGVQVSPQVDYKGFSIHEPVSDIKNIILDHFNNSIGIEFTAFHYTDSKRNKFAYQLQGVNDQWITTGAGNNAVTYDDLSAGDYVFKVRAASSNEVWGEEKTLQLTILPAPWLTWWAYTLYAIAFVITLFFIVYKRTKILEARALHLQETVNERTQQLVEEKSKVEQLLSRKNEEFANVSHEFRTPLTLILGPLSQIIKTAKNEKEIEKLGVIQRNGYRLLRMVDQLLNMETFRIKSITQRAPQAIGRTVSMLTEAFADLAHEKGIDLTLANKLNINFEFTPDALEKILLNLLSNAVKYTRPGGHITVATERTNNKEFKLSVSDTGIGIPEDKLQSIFERYSRVLDENSEQVAGAGIGLALVKELVEAHQGRIEVESQLGKGTTIIVYLPIIGEVDDEQVRLHNNDEIVAMELMSLTSQSTAQPTHAQVIQLDEHLGKPSVLVIEDNADMRAYISNSIQDDYQVLTAKDGEEGVAVAIEQVPDLIISDIMMPKKDGYQTTQELRNNSATNHIPIILLTARGDRESRLKGWYEKADEYLTKPFDVEELKMRLQNLLDIRNILKKRFAENVFNHTVDSNENVTVEEPTDIESNQNRLQQIFITKLNSVIENIYTDPSATVVQITQAMAMSERQLLRKIKNILDMTPNEYLRRFRLEKAKMLLLQGKNTSFVTYDVGFSSQSYFGKCFKAQYGTPPAEYQKSAQ